MKHAPIRDILWLFIFTRLLLVIVTYFGYILLTAPKYSSTPVDATVLFASWNHWDAVHCINIAHYGYHGQYEFAFFPLFPLLVSGIAHILGDWSYLLAGTLLTNGALLGALFVIYQIAVDMAGEQAARRSLLYICIFPTAFYFFAPYNESLYLLLAAGSFLAMRRQQWWLAGVLGLLASLSRSAGILLVIPYIIELWMSREGISPVSTRTQWLLKLLPVLLIPLGTLLYALFCWHITGNPLVFVSVQSHWDRHTAWPWVGIWQALANLFWFQPFGSFYEAHIILDLTATISFIVLVILGKNRLRPSYTIWMAVLLLYTLINPATGQNDVLVSNQRFVIELFPAFITLAMLGIKHPRLHQALMLLFPTLLTTLSILFVMNRWMV